MPGRKSFTNAWQSITKTDVSIAGTSIAEFGETPVLQRFDKV
jgi:hypothetical protein